VGAGLVDAQHVRVVDARHRLGLAEQAGPRFLGARDAHRQQLDRDLAVELGVVRGVDDPHAAGAEHADGDEPADRCPTGERDGGRRVGRIRVVRCELGVIEPRLHGRIARHPGR
jgi:hypothetical protein